MNNEYILIALKRQVYPPFPAIAGVRTVVANWQVRYTSTLLRLL